MDIKQQAACGVQSGRVRLQAVRLIKSGRRGDIAELG
jgi:hypothetical protein